jgi:hypothetical protein
MSSLPEPKRITARHVSGENAGVTLELVPDWCPLCNRNIEPHMVHATMWGDEHRGKVQVVYLCTSRDCQNLFISTYQRVGSHQVDYSDSRFTFRGSAPWKPVPTDFPKEVKELSPSFVDVYNEAIAAEGRQLTNLVGMGMRKALEFLVKDFAVRGHPEDAERIKQLQLGPVIETYCDDPKLKAAAKRATWLGNDETHYERRWENKDIEDLKTLVRLTVGWIEREILTEQYTEDMPDKGAPPP